MRVRVQIFRNDNKEFSSLDDEHVKSLIRIYDINAQKKFEPSDSALSVVGFLILWFGWMFKISASGAEIVEYSYERVPQILILNAFISSASAGITYEVLHLFSSMD